MTLKEMQPQLLALTPEEKSQAIQLLVQSLSKTWQGIETTPKVMGGDACIRQTRIPVWLLVSLQRQGATEAYILEDYPHPHRRRFSQCLALCRDSCRRN